MPDTMREAESLHNKDRDTGFDGRERRGRGGYRGSDRGYGKYDGDRDNDRDYRDRGERGGYSGYGRGRGRGGRDREDRDFRVNPFNSRKKEGM